MGALATAISHAAVSAESRSTLRDPEEWLLEALGVQKTVAGVSVNTTTALKYTAFYSAVDAISRSMAQVPLHFYARGEGDARSPATGHPVYRVVHLRPNPEQTPFIWRQTMQSWALRWGNAYSEIERNGAGRPTAVWHIPTDRVDVGRAGDGTLAYQVRNEHGSVEKVLGHLDVIHIRTMGDGMIGYSPVQLFKQTIGLGLAAEQYGAAFFGNSARPGGVLEHPATMTDEALKHLRTSWTSRYGGSENAFTPAILEEGMVWKQTTIPNEDAQFLETRQFQVSDIARIFHIPPHKLADLLRATFSNIEHQAIEYVVDCLDPWFINWEQELNFKLLLGSEQGRYYAEFKREALLRGDTESRYKAYATGRQWGWLSANDVRRLENLNPLPGEEGNIYLSPVNMQPASSFLAGNAAEGQGAPGGQTGEAASRRADDIASTHRIMLQDLCQRVINRAVRSLRKALKRAADFDSALQGVANELADQVWKILGPAAVAYHIAVGGDRGTAGTFINLLARQQQRKLEEYIRATEDRERVLDIIERDWPLALTDRIIGGLAVLGGTQASPEGECNATSDAE